VPAKRLDYVHTDFSRPRYLPQYLVFCVLPSNILCRPSAVGYGKNRQSGTFLALEISLPKAHHAQCNQSRSGILPRHGGRVSITYLHEAAGCRFYINTVTQRQAANRSRHKWQPSSLTPPHRHP
jgi:hypothetical protein